MAKSKGGTPATKALASAGISFETHAYDHDPRSGVGYGLEAAAALGLDQARVFKTILVDSDGELVVAVVPVARQVSLKALAQAAGGKRAATAEPARAERATGYVVGGISPIGQRTRHRTFLDSSMADLDTVFVSGGKRGFDIELTPADLAAATGAVFAAIAT